MSCDQTREEGRSEVTKPSDSMTSDEQQQLLARHRCISALLLYVPDARLVIVVELFRTEWSKF